MALLQTEKFPGRIRNRPLKDYSGMTFGRLTATRLVERRDGGEQQWSFSCSCGGSLVASIKRVKSGNTSSCGCLRHEMTLARNTTHGQSGTPTYRSWKDMRARCYNEKQSDYPNYGARGIVVCPRWERFENFLSDMGRRPDGTTLDRKDPNGHYEPHNCRWADAETQANNKRETIRITIDGETKSLAQWCRRFGVDVSKAGYRYRHGLDPFSARDFRT